MDFNKLYYDIGEFSVKIFHDAKPVDHLKKLRNESLEAIEKPDDVYEYSDCLLALLAAAYKSGFSPEYLINSSFEKLEILRNRKWEKIEDGTYQHIKI